MTAISTEDLRQRIDAEHQRAIDALSVIQTYLDHGAAKIPSANGTPKTKIPRQPRRGGTNRNKVLAAVKDGWIAASAISESTGLETKQVRGVLNAKGISETIEKRDVDGITEYRAKPE